MVGADYVFIECELRSCGRQRKKRFRVGQQTFYMRFKGSLGRTPRPVVNLTMTLSSSIRLFWIGHVLKTMWLARVFWLQSTKTESG